MIADKILSSHSIIQLTGDAVHEIFTDSSPLLLDPRDIEGVTILTKNYSNDIEAILAAKKIFGDVTGNLGSNTTMIEEYNPEFYPSLLTSEIEKKKTDELDGIFGSIIDSVADSDNPSSLAVPITHTFDVLGDYVQAKISAAHPHFSVMIKIIATPSEYVQQKTSERLAAISFEPTIKSTTTPYYH
jgi:hypothetical protein